MQSNAHRSEVLIIYKIAAAWRQPGISRQLIDLGADVSALVEHERDDWLWQW